MSLTKAAPWPRARAVTYRNGQEAAPRAPLDTARGQDLVRQERGVQGLSSSPEEHANSGSLRNSTSSKPAVHFLYFSYRKSLCCFFNFSKKVDYFGYNQSLFVYVAGKPKFSYLTSIN